MNAKNILSSSIIGMVFLLSGCGESPKQEAKAPVLAMDVPHPDTNLQKTKDEFGIQSLPDLQKSNIKFTIDPSAIKKQIAQKPVTDEASCLSLVDPLRNRADVIQRNEGIWGDLEKAAELKDYSSIGMQLDSKINTLLAASRHLCKTAKGLPYTRLASFINSRLEERGEAALREELATMGETATDIESYLAYGAFAKASRSRVLDYPSVQESILWAEMFVGRYEEFSKRLSDPKTMKTALADALALHDAVADFLVANKNIALAVKEERAVPYFMTTF
jgi:hypothetical protein